MNPYSHALVQSLRNYQRPAGNCMGQPRLCKAEIVHAEAN